MNVTCQTGRISNEPELKYTNSGTPVTNFAVYVDRNFKTRNGERKKDKFQCVAWGKTAEIAAEYCKTGDMVEITGSLEEKVEFDSDRNPNNSTIQINVNLIKVIYQNKKNREGQGQDQDSGNDQDLPF